MKAKTLDNVNMETAQASISDIKVHGSPGDWVCICKASSESQGWMKSTKAMEIWGLGCLVQVTTQQRNPDGSYAISEALTFIHGATISDDRLALSRCAD